MVNGTSALVSKPLGVACEAIVVIPVRNEEQSILHCLGALASQHGIQPDQFEIILLLNNCKDDSETIALRFADGHPELTIHLVSLQLSPDESNIGTVRRMLMDEACGRFSRSNRLPAAILTTDADTTVDSHWVANNLAELRQGVDAVAGRIALHAREMRHLAPRVRQQYRWELTYGLLRARLECHLDPVPWDPWPRHHQNFCGSLAITAAMYLQAGGIPDVKHLEDVALCASILRKEGKIRHSPLVQVRTSARLEGRVGIGLSSHLRDFDGNQLSMVEAVALAAKKLRASCHLRKEAVSEDERSRVLKTIDDAWTGSRQIPMNEAVDELRKAISLEEQKY